MDLKKIIVAHKWAEGNLPTVRRNAEIISGVCLLFLLIMLGFVGKALYLKKNTTKLLKKLIA